MTKMIKLSLVAAVAVAGLSTTVSAQPLEEAIKNVDVSGNVRYRFDDKDGGTGASSQTNEYQLQVLTKSKVNDSVTANVKIEANGVVGVSEEVQATNDATGDRDVALVVSEANFAVKVAGATVIAGKQGLPTPFTNADQQKGSGVLALIPAGPVTVAAAHFVNNNIDSTGTAKRDDTVDVHANDMTVLAAIAKVGPADLQAWYVNGGETATSTLPKGFSAIALKADAKVGPATVKFNHTELKGKSNSLATQTLTKIAASAKVSIATVTAAYAVGGTDGNIVAFDKYANTAFAGWAATTSGMNDMSAYMIDAKVNATNAITAQLTIIGGDRKVGTASVDFEETIIKVGYKMSKNFNTYVRLSDYNLDEVNDQFRGRLEVKYTF